VRPDARSDDAERIAARVRLYTMCAELKIPIFVSGKTGQIDELERWWRLPAPAAVPVSKDE
jgi:hypothetical protein